MDKDLRHAVMSGSRRLWIPAAVFVFAVVVGGSFLWLNSDRGFEPALWQQRPDLRSRMMRDLLERYELVGMTRPEVDELLGKPNEYDHNQRDAYIYRTGTSGVDDMWLEINFVDGIATTTRHVPD